MKNRVTSQRGSLPLVVLGVVLLLTGVGGAGWYVWQKRNKPESRTNTNQQAQNDGQKKEKNATSDPTEGGKYLVVKEWGVKIPLSADIAGAYYAFSSEDRVDYIALYDKVFDDLENTAGMSCGGSNAYQFYSISRVQTENVSALEQEHGPGYREFPFDKKHVYSGLGAHQAPPPCADLNPDPYGDFQEDKNILDIANDKEQAFDRAFENLQQQID